MFKPLIASILLLWACCPLIAAFADESNDQASVVLIPSQEEPALQQRRGPLTEEEVYELVWNLPEVQREVNNVLAQGGAPSASVGFRPQSESDREASRLFYTIHFEAGRVDKPPILPVFVVDAVTAEILVYDSSSGKLVSLDVWRQQRNRTGQAR